MTNERNNGSKMLDWFITYPHVAHYTTTQGLLGILQTRQLWATHYPFLNDHQEIEHGSKYIDQIYQKTIKSSTQISDERRKFYLENAEVLRNLWWSALSPNGNKPEFFISSFCGIPSESQEYKNKTRLGADGLLSQWRAYGNNGGFALIFDSSQLNDSYRYYHKECKIHTEIDSSCKNCLKQFFANLFMPVNYDYHDSNIEEYEAYSSMEAISKILVQDDIKLIEDIFQNNLPLFRENMIGIIALLVLQKHRGFQEENEIRFACLNRLERFRENGGGYANNSPYLISTEGYASRLKIDFHPSALKKIIIGPQSTQDKMETLIKHYLEANSYENIQIIKSSIPFIPSK